MKIRKKCANCTYIFDVEKDTKKEIKCPKCGSNAIDDYDINLIRKQYLPTFKITPMPPNDDVWPWNLWKWKPIKYWCGRKRVRQQIKK